MRRAWGVALLLLGVVAGVAAQGAPALAAEPAAGADSAVSSGICAAIATAG